LAFLSDPASQLNSYRSDAAFGVRATKHREWCTQPVASSRGLPGRYPLHSGEIRCEQQGVGQRGTVTIAAADRFREPDQLPSRTAGPAHPIPVAPIHTGGAQRALMLPGTSGSTGADFGHVDFVDFIKRPGGVTGQKAAQPRHEPGANHDRNPLHPRFAVQFEEPTNLRGLIRGRYYRNPRFDGPAGQPHLRSGWGRHDHHVDTGINASAGTNR
jgi:hypothetical protein